MEKLKLIRVATIPASMYKLLNGQLKFLDKYFDVVGICSQGKYFEDLRNKEGVRLIDVEIRREISIIKDLKALIKLINIFIIERPIIVHSHTPKAGFVTMIAAKISRVPIRIHTFTGIRFETTTGILRKVLILMDKITCWCATTIIPEGDGVKKVLIKNRITKKPLVKILNGNINGIDTEYFNPLNIDEQNRTKLRKELSIRLDDFVFCFIGRIVADKGINELVTAFDNLSKKYDNLKLILVGPLNGEADPPKAETLTTIRTHQNIKTVGLQQDVRPYLVISDLFVLPSYREGFPNVVLQASAMGRACVVSDVNGCNEIIRDGFNGLIISKKDSVSLEEAMERLYRDRALLEKMANNSRELVVEKFRSEEIWQALLEEYERLIKKNER